MFHVPSVLVPNPGSRLGKKFQMVAGIWDVDKGALGNGVGFGIHDSKVQGEVLK